MRIVVTGAAGFIGAQIAHQLVDLGHDVVGLDALDPSVHDGMPDGLADAVDHRWVDVTTPRSWLDVLDGADAVCHQAAKVGLGADFADVRDYVWHNDVGTAVGLWALHQVGFRGRLVVASSMVVYGEGSYACATHGPIRPGPRLPADLEAGRFEPLARTAAPRWRRVSSPRTRPPIPATSTPRRSSTRSTSPPPSAAAHDLPVTLLRYHNVYGPGMPRDTPYAGVASIFRSQLASGRPPQVFEDGGQRRDFVHVDDVARANVLALTGPAYDGALNVASGRPRTILDVARAISASAAGPSPRVTGDYRLGDVRHVVASPARAASSIGFVAQTGSGCRPAGAGPRPAPPTSGACARPAQLVMSFVLKLAQAAPRNTTM